jgi:hypothetical protein
MRISAFLQLYNELSNGHLRRCLDNCRRWADAIYIYDDCSTDGSRDVYPEYTPANRVILGESRDFNAEIFHKQQLLDLVKLEGITDWIVWIDGDAVFDSYYTENMRHLLEDIESAGADCGDCGHLNLWRHPAWHRLDSGFNDLRPVCFWKMSDKLHYRPRSGLHRQQFPAGMGKPVRMPFSMLHYGFASREGIVRKYRTYKSLGAANVDRLADETTLELAKVPALWFPAGLLPPDYNTCEKPVGGDLLAE